jgi:hypothetical protein
MGIVYLIQPGVLIGTNRYKIGASEKSNVSRVHKGYEKEVKVICIMGTEEPFVLERLIKRKFNNEFEILSGSEWFIGDYKKMRRIFIDMVYLFEEEQESSEVVIAKEDVVVEKPEETIIFVPSLKKFEINPNTKLYEKRVIRDDKSYIVSIHPESINKHTSTIVNRWIRKHPNLESTFPFGVIKEEVGANVYDIIHNHCEFCGKKCTTMKSKKRHMKYCKHSKGSEK